MKPILFLFLAISAAANPVRVLYIDTPVADTAPLHNAMRDLGRDAIYFDYAKDKVDTPNLFCECKYTISFENTK